MKKKLLCCALLGAMATATSAMAQDFDNRWYVSGGIGYNFQDDDRGTEDTAFGTIGLGKFLTPNWSLDVEANYQNPMLNGSDLLFSQYGLSVDSRYHFLREGSNWWPYVRMGLGYQKAEEEFNNFPSPNSPGQRVAAGPPWRSTGSLSPLARPRSCRAWTCAPSSRTSRAPPAAPSSSTRACRVP